MYGEDEDRPCLPQWIVLVDRPSGPSVRTAPVDNTSGPSQWRLQLIRTSKLLKSKIINFECRHVTLVSSEIRRMINEFETRCPSLISMTSRFGPFQPLSRSVFTGLYSGVAKILYTTLFSWPPDVDRKWIKVPSLLKFFGFI